MQTEFKKGDLVTFHNYDCNKPINAKVIEIVRNPLSFVKNDNRVWYRLTGVKQALLTVCTGLSIVESNLFKLTTFRHWSE